MDVPAPAIGRAAELAFDAAVGPLYESLVRRLTLVVGDSDEAHDLAQAAYLRAWQGWSRFDGRDRRAWLYTIALRLAFNELRRRARAVRAFRVAESPAWEPAIATDLWEALRRLEPKPRAALLLNVLDGYSHEEIAGILRAPVGTVASWIARSKRDVRNDLKRGDHDE